MLFRTVLLVAVVSMALGSLAHARLPIELGDGQALPSLAPMLEQTTPSVVNIATYTTVQVRNRLLEDPFFRRFFSVPDSRRRYRRTQSAGSGVVVDADGGYIVTNHHVVEGADEISVTLADGRTLTAELVGSDSQVDLAVLRVKPTGRALTAIRFADSQRARVGDFVVAIGNPFGLSQTVTSGIVSALGRTGLGIDGFEDFIQTDAPINPGNSGGALVDLRGALLGINTAIFAPAGGNVGIGFAIPANMVQAVMNELIEHGRVRRGYLGMAIQALNPDLAAAFDLRDADGVVVVDVQDGSVADEAGLRTGDVILKMGDRRVERPADFHSQVAVTFVGDTVTLTVRRGQRERRLKLRIAEEEGDRVAGGRYDPRLAGTSLQNFRDPDALTQGAGVLVTGVDADSKAGAADLRRGDVIVAVNRRPVRDLTELRESVLQSDQQLLLRVYRAGRFGYIALR